ncbi:septal ring lytic transglycosylase RlpA family protein [Oscillatoria amoena NRMC-F 0135]|nr:septal ring lytic transglycosylase RlpA family protein [Oscillatoria amoena NRMC-F 0135]
MYRTPYLLVFLFLCTAAHAQVQTGKASFYADKFEGRPTASGEKYRHNKLTAAHKTLPFGTKVKVTNLENNQAVEVIINDRGPYIDGRIIDLSRSAAEQLGFINQGLAEVKVEVIDPGDGKKSDPLKPIGQVSVDEKEFYNFEVGRLKPAGFGVQIGTYQELVNLIRLADNLKSSYQKKSNRAGKNPKRCEVLRLDSRPVSQPGQGRTTQGRASKKIPRCLHC